MVPFFIGVRGGIKVNKAIKFIERLQMGIGVLFLSLFFVVIIIQIVTRHLGISVIWTVEVATNSFIWAILMGAAVMVNRREHFNFNLLEKKLTKKKKVMLAIVNDTLLILFNAAIFVYGLRVTQEFWNYNWTSLPSLKMGYIWIAIPIMSFTMVLYSLSHIVNYIKILREKGE